MTIIVKIYDIFKLSHGGLVIICGHIPNIRSFHHRRASVCLESGEEIQTFLISGIREFCRQTKNFDRMAIDVLGEVHLNLSEDQTGAYFLKITSD